MRRIKGVLKYNIAEGKYALNSINKLQNSCFNIDKLLRLFLQQKQISSYFSVDFKKSVKLLFHFGLSFPREY